MKHTKEYLFSNRDLLKLILPLVVEQLLAVAVGLADSIMVANVGEAAVSAVSLVDSVNVLLINIFSAVATGGAVVAGQYLGKKKAEEAGKAGEQLLVFATGIAVVIMLLMYLGKSFILNVVFGDIDADVMNYANTYLLIVTAAIPFIALYNGGAALFRAMGNSKITMKISILMNMINVVGNAVLIYGFHRGVEGVAVPTLVSRIVAAVAVTALLREQTLLIHIRKPFRYHFDWGMVRKILHIGVPNGVENSMFQLGKILLLSLVSGFGTASIAANAVGNSIAMFEILPGLAIGLGMVTVVSQCVGAGDYEQVRYYTGKLMRYAYIAMIAVNAVMIFMLPLIIQVYQLSAETGKMAMEILLLHGICAAVIWPISFTLPNTLRSANDVRFTMMVGVGPMWVCRLFFGFVLGKYLKMGVFGVWTAMMIDWVVRSIFFAVRYRGKAWEQMKIG